jgi:hypothetical protein
MIAQKVEIIFDLWKKRTMYQIRKGMDRNEALYLLFEKVFIYNEACKNTKPLLDIDLIVTDVAEFLIHEDPRLAPVAIKILQSGNAN